MTTCMICNQESNRIFDFHTYAVFACSSCGFQQLNPQPTDQELFRIYSERYFLDEGNEEITKAVNQLKRATAALYLSQLETETSSPKGLSLLEIGCGMGDFLLEAQLRGFKVSGLEVTEHLVDFANHRLGASYVEKGYIESSTYLKESFDIIAFFDVIEHVRNPLSFMRRVNGLLKRNGKAYLVTPSLDSWSAKLLGKNWMEYKVEHLSYFNQKATTLLLEKTGFYNIKFYPNYKFLSFDYINRHFVRFPIRGLSFLVNLIRKFTPHWFANIPVKVIASGMAVIAEKRN